MLDVPSMEGLGVAYDNSTGDVVMKGTAFLIGEHREKFKSKPSDADPSEYLAWKVRVFRSWGV